MLAMDDNLVVLVVKKLASLETWRGRCKEMGMSATWWYQGAIRLDRGDLYGGTRGLATEERNSTDFKTRDNSLSIFKFYNVSMAR